jgi:nucleotide-binding universal stress UspA family protein
MEEGRFLRILASVEGAESDQRTALAAIDLAARAGAKLVLINVVDAMLVNRVQRLTARSAAEVQVEMEEKGWKALYYAEDLSKGRGVPTMVLQNSGMPDREILAEATRLKADLIVLAYPRAVEGQAKRLVQGHVERILEGAPCAVLVVR